jgi:hypothetical protein
LGNGLRTFQNQWDKENQRLTKLKVDSLKREMQIKHRVKSRAGKCVEPKSNKWLAVWGEHENKERLDAPSCCPTPKEAELFLFSFFF